MSTGVNKQGGGAPAMRGGEGKSGNPKTSEIAPDCGAKGADGKQSADEPNFEDVDKRIAELFAKVSKAESEAQCIITEFEIDVRKRFDDMFHRFGFQLKADTLDGIVRSLRSGTAAGFQKQRDEINEGLTTLRAHSVRRA